MDTNDKTKCLNKVFELKQTQQWAYICLKDMVGQIGKILKENEANNFKDISLKYTGDLAVADYSINEAFKSIEKNYKELNRLFDDLFDDVLGIKKEEGESKND